MRQIYYRFMFWQTGPYWRYGCKKFEESFHFRPVSAIVMGNLGMTGRNPGAAS